MTRVDLLIGLYPPPMRFINCELGRTAHLGLNYFNSWRFFRLHLHSHCLLSLWQDHLELRDLHVQVFDLIEQLTHLLTGLDDSLLLVVLLRHYVATHDVRVG